MSYVVYHTESTMEVKRFKFRGHADNFIKKTVARKIKNGWRNVNDKTYGVADYEEYMTQIVYMKKVRNILNPEGGEIEIPSNTPACCDPSTETYHCM